MMDMLTKDDLEYFDDKFNGVYKELKDTRQELCGKIENDVDKHSDNPCKNVQEHWKDEHKGMALTIVIIAGTIVATLIGLYELGSWLVKGINK